MQVATPLKQTLITHTEGLLGKNLRILLSSFGGEDFQKFALKLLYFQIVFYH